MGRCQANDGGSVATLSIRPLNAQLLDLPLSAQLPRLPGLLIY